MCSQHYSIQFQFLVRGDYVHYAAEIWLRLLEIEYQQ